MDISGISNANVMSQAAFHVSGRNAPQYLDWNSLRGDDAAMLAAAKEFEAYFIHMMFRAMRTTVDSSRGILPQTQTEEIFRDMIDEETARNMAQSGGVGLAQQIFRQMTAGRNFVQEALITAGYYGTSEVEAETEAEIVAELE